MLDADEPLPKLQVAQTGGSTVVSWPFITAGVLEETASLASPSWTNSTSVVELSNGTNYATALGGGVTKFFRLRVQ